MDSDTIEIVAAVVRFARDLSPSEAYTRWANRWLDGSDRSASAAKEARRCLLQYTRFYGPTHAVWCLEHAADAARRLAEGNRQWARDCAEAAGREGRRADEPTGQRYGPGGSRRGRSSDPREV
jgi:hypothetical protein